MQPTLKDIAKLWAKFELETLLKGKEITVEKFGEYLLNDQNTFLYERGAEKGELVRGRFPSLLERVYRSSEA